MKNSTHYTIMAVDDAKDSLMLLEFDLSDADYEVIIANSGNEALLLLKETNVHLILLDMYIPGISGLETLKEIKANSDVAHIPVIMLSSSGDEEKIVTCLELGADDYVIKPYIPNVLLARMRNSLRFMEKTLELEILAKIDFLTKVNNRGSFQELACQQNYQSSKTKWRNYSICNV
jgi:DNA-binding response OmpR family regulator